MRWKGKQKKSCNVWTVFLIWLFVVLFVSLTCTALNRAASCSTVWVHNKQNFESLYVGQPQGIRVCGSSESVVAALQTIFIQPRVGGKVDLGLEVLVLKVCSVDSIGKLDEKAFEDCGVL